MSETHAAALLARRPRLLDLFCCEGGAAKGYQFAGFEVYGVDLFKHRNAKGQTVGFSQKRYPYLSAQADAIKAMLHLLAGGLIRFGPTPLSPHLGLADFDAIHASPPCQHASAGTRAMRAHGDDRHPALIEPVRELLIQTGLPYVIENVSGAALRDPVTLCGTMAPFYLCALDVDGTPLEMWRHRLFETNWGLAAPGACRHGWFSEQVAGAYGGARRVKKLPGDTLVTLAPRDRDSARNDRGGGYVPRSAKVQQELLGIDWMTVGGMAQCVPWAYTRWVGRQLFAHLEVRAAA